MRLRKTRQQKHLLFKSLSKQDDVLPSFEWNNNRSITFILLAIVERRGNICSSFLTLLP